MTRSWLVDGFGCDARQRCAVRVRASSEMVARVRARRLMRAQGLRLPVWVARELDVLVRGMVP